MPFGSRPLLRVRKPRLFCCLLTRLDSDGGYHGYWAQDLYNVNSHHGTPQDLKNLVAAAHSKVGRPL